MHDSYKVKNLIFEITNTCNFKCEYCFENTGLENLPSFIEYPIVKKAIDKYIIDPHTSYMITFFGGEPLLQFSLIEQAVYYANEKARHISSFVSYNIVTNGSLLTEQIIDFFCRQNFYVFFSYDGNTFCQNKYRKLKDGRDSDSIVQKNLCKIIQAYKKANLEDNLVVRMTITGDTINTLTERYLNLIQLGCKKVTFALVSSCATARYAITESSLDILREEYQKLSDLYISEIAAGVSHNRFFQSLIYKIAKGYSKKYFCDCGKAYIGIGTKGDLYPCEGFFGIDQFCTGNVDDWTSANHSCYICIESVEKNITCKECWAKYLCGGGCYQENYLRTADINKRSEIMCETYRIAAEVALVTYYKLKEANLLHSFLILSEEKLPSNAIPYIDSANVKILDNYMFISQHNEFIHIELDSISKLILMLCDGNNTIQNIVHTISSKFNETEDIVFSDVSELLNRFIEYSAIYLTL